MDAEQEALHWEEVRENNDLLYEDGEDSAIWLEIGVDGKPELGVVQRRGHGCAAVSGNR
jgi:hypothetical protein